MPANLPPQYFETEKKLKTASTIEEKIRIYEELLSIVPKHKGTEKLQAILKTKIAKLKSTLDKKQSTAKHKPSHNIERAGAGQIVIIGPPNAGKSMLIKSLTNANPQIGNYPFTTYNPYPAMMEFNNIQIQLIDTPPITNDYMESWHPELIKTADGTIIVTDLSNPSMEQSLLTILEKLREKKIELTDKDKSIDKSEEYNENFKGQIFYIKSLLVANKNDVAGTDHNFNRLKEHFKPDFHLVSTSAKTGAGLEELKKSIFTLLNIVRVYSKAPGKKAEFDDPFTLKKGSTVLDLAKAVHKDFSHKLKFARIWSENKYQGQKVNQEYVLEDEDIIELHI
ncbi:MAG: GTPase [Candidatus Aminicenantaceae bacterium]